MDTSSLLENVKQQLQSAVWYKKWIWNGHCCYNLL